MSPNRLSRLDSAEQNLHDIIADISGELLDKWYDEYPHANAFGAEYNSQSEPNGDWFIGRSDGASDSSSGIDYLYRKFPDPETGRDTNEYIYGKYGWADLNELLDEAPRLRQAFESGVEREMIDESQVDRFDSAIDAVADALAEERNSFSLSEIGELIESHEIEPLRTILSTSEEDGRVLWQLLFSKNEDEDTIKNEVSVEFIDENAGVMFVRSERYFHHPHREPDGKWYAYGAVIGIDDTDERFFIHRLESDNDLRNPEFEWTLGAVKEKMGFDLYYEEIPDAQEIPFDRRVLLQGDVAVVRRDKRTKLWEHYDTVYENKKSQIVNSAFPDIGEDDNSTEAARRANDEFGSVDGVSILRSGRVRIRTEKDTDRLKELQTEIGLSEETVREEQERRGINRLSAKRRRNIIHDWVREKVYEFACEQKGLTDEEVQKEAESTARSEFSDEEQQVNLILGNHTVILGPATEHPDISYSNDTDILQAVVVPNSADGYIWHDEHSNKKITLGEGVYEFRFLNGHEDQWWMN